MTSIIGIAGEKILSRRAVPQPHPEIHKGGDCGACALAGALGIPIEAVYESFNSEGITNQGEMSRVLRCSVPDYADRIVEEPCYWRGYHGFESFGHFAYFDSIPWFNYVRMAVDADYYGLAKVAFTPDVAPETNHWVLICGAKTNGSEVGQTITGSILISCSVRGEYWSDIGEFLKHAGGYDVLFVRPLTK